MQPPPKVILFDIGGVCVLSPLTEIERFERATGLPPGWVNHAIRYASPNGCWQRLERGEIELDADFFKGFTADLESAGAWQAYLRTKSSEPASLKDLANPTQLGDHVSLKAETTSQDPNKRDPKTVFPYPRSDGNVNNAGSPQTSKQAKDTTIGDPVSLEAEDVVEASSSSSTLSRNTPSASQSSNSRPSFSPNQPPKVDGERLFWSMMAASRHPDPYIFPALQRLLSLPKAQRPIIAALSNTVIFPPDHPWSKRTTNVDSVSSSTKDKGFSTLLTNPESFFDVYVSSSAVGIRKPSRQAYELTMARLNEHLSNRNNDEGSSPRHRRLKDVAKATNPTQLGDPVSLKAESPRSPTSTTNSGNDAKGKPNQTDLKDHHEPIKPEEVIFLDDIGENLKTARSMGMRTIKVQAGKTWRAVKALEEALAAGGRRIELMDERTRRSKL